ncbi:MAG: ImmA/IrrE family metallo-endopeptidase [Pseudobdellovibrionaceae bacterium]
MGYLYDQIAADRYREIEEFAEFLWGEYSVNGRIDPLKILDEKEITYSFGDYGDAFDGLLEYEDDDFHVYLNQSRLVGIGKPRTRFTASHELGHYFIDEHRNGLVSGSLAPHASFTGYQSNQIIEIEADHFASHLLMPASLFAKKVANGAVGMEAVLRLSEAFGTSRTACGVRLVKEDILSCALFKWNKDGLHWKFLSDEFYQSGLRRSIEKGSSAPEGSGTEEVLQSLKKPTGVVRRGTTVNTWFPNISHESGKNDILIEETISLGKFGALTLVYREP